MNKKFISSVLAGACALSMTSISVFAAQTETEISALDTDGYASQQVTVSSTTAMPALKVTIPTQADLVLNPYKINVTTPITGSDTVMSPEYVIKNESECGITVSATVKATPAGGAVIATSALKGTETTKSVFMYLETTKTSDNYYGEYVAKKVTARAPATLTPEQEDANAACDAQMLITTKDTTKNIATLAAGNTTAQNIYFKVQGAAVTAPKTPWVAADKVDLTMTLKITPNANAETSAGGPAGPAWSATGTTAAMTLSVTDGTLTNTNGNNYTWTLTEAEAGTAGTVTPTLNLADGWSVSTATQDSGRALVSNSVNTSTGAFEIDNRCRAADTAKVTITITDGSDTEDIVIDITVTA